MRLWGLLVTVNLPPLSALFSTDVAAGFWCIIGDGEHFCTGNVQTTIARKQIKNKHLFNLHGNVYRKSAEKSFWFTLKKKKKNLPKRRPNQ